MDANHLRRQGNHVGAIDFAGVAVACMLRAYRVRDSAEFDARHDLWALARSSGVLAFSRGDERRGCGVQHVGSVATAADASISRLGSGTRSLDEVYGNGMTLHEPAAWLAADLPVTDALNLDGGLSTQLGLASPRGRVGLRG